MSLIFQELQQLDGEFGQVHSALPLEEDEFLRCMAFKAASVSEPVNAEPVEEPLWSPNQKREFFSPGASHWVASGWSITSMPEHSTDLRSLTPAGSVEDCFFDHSLGLPGLASDQEPSPHRSPRATVKGARISENRATISRRRDRSQRGDSTDKKVNVVAAVAIGLVAVSFAVGLAQSRSGARVRH